MTTANRTAPKVEHNGRVTTRSVPRFSPDVVGLFNTLLSQVTLNAGADDFAEVAALVTKAKREVASALAGAEEG